MGHGLESQRLSQMRRRRELGIKPHETYAMKYPEIVEIAYKNIIADWGEEYDRA